MSSRLDCVFLLASIALIVSIATTVITVSIVTTALTAIIAIIAITAIIVIVEEDNLAFIGKEDLRNLYISIMKCNYRKHEQADDAGFSTVRQLVFLKV
nr:hypothetical protein [Paenibacillus faecalis]